MKRPFVLALFVLITANGFAQTDAATSSHALGRLEPVQATFKN